MEGQKGKPPVNPPYQHVPNRRAPPVFKPRKIPHCPPPISCWLWQESLRSQAFCSGLCFCLGWDSHTGRAGLERLLSTGHCSTLSFPFSQLPYSYWHHQPSSSSCQILFLQSISAALPFSAPLGTALVLAFAPELSPSNFNSVARGSFLTLPPPQSDPAASCLPTVPFLCSPLPTALLLVLTLR